MKKWKTLSRQKIFEHPRITLYEDTVELPSGHVTQYLRHGSRPGASCIIPVREDGKILLQKEYNYPSNSWLYQFPGGAIEAGESPQEAAARELAEEAGFGATLTSLGWWYIDNRRTDSKFFAFVATDLHPVEAETDAEEEFEDYWYTPEEIEALIRTTKIVNPSALAMWCAFKVR